MSPKGPQTRAFRLLRAMPAKARRGTNGENLLPGWGEFPAAVALGGVKRSHGSGHLYLKHGSYYGRWRGLDGRFVNKKIGKVRKRGEKDGITRADAERGLRRLVEVETRRPEPSPEERARMVDEVADELRERLAIEGARLSYRQNCESMQRIHISPVIGKRRIETVTRQDVERLGRSMLARGLAPKTVRNVITFLHAVFALALA